MARRKTHDKPAAQPERKAQRRRQKAPKAAQHGAESAARSPRDRIGGEVGEIIDAAADKHGLSRAFMHKLAKVESGGNPSISNTQGTDCVGLYQFDPGTARDFGVADRLDPAQSANGAGKLITTRRRFLERNLGRPITAGEAYLSHQQGAGGALALLRHPEMNAVEALMTHAKVSKGRAVDSIVKNGGNLSMTAEQFARRWTSRFDGVPLMAKDDTSYKNERKSRRDTDLDVGSSQQSLRTREEPAVLPTAPPVSSRPDTPPPQQKSDPVSNFFNTLFGGGKRSSSPRPDTGFGYGSETPPARRQGHDDGDSVSRERARAPARHTSFSHDEGLFGHASPSRHASSDDFDRGVVDTGRLSSAMEEPKPAYEEAHAPSKKDQQRPSRRPPRSWSDIQNDLF